MQKVSDDAYDEFCTCTTGNRTVLRRGYLFACRNIGRPRNLCLQGSSPYTPLPPRSSNTRIEMNLNSAIFSMFLLGVSLSTAGVKLTLTSATSSMFLFRVPPNLSPSFFFQVSPPPSQQQELTRIYLNFTSAIFSLFFLGVLATSVTRTG